jgi:8-oxo-dGTP diphosphatase
LQRVTNCVLVKDNQVLLLQKPRRNWWVAPGGKMEHGETIREAVVREYREETGIYLKNPALKGVFTFVIQENDKVVSEWMMFSFLATDFAGENKEECEEGILEWHDKDAIAALPMAPGDYHIIDYLLQGNAIIYGTFIYTPDFELISYRLDPS